jgi:hypothetical protein
MRTWVMLRSSFLQLRVVGSARLFIQFCKKNGDEKLFFGASDGAVLRLRSTTTKRKGKNFGEKVLFGVFLAKKTAKGLRQRRRSGEGSEVSSGAFKA